MELQAPVRPMGSEDRLNGIAIGFCHLFQVPIPGEQESLHVAREDQRFNHPPKDPPGARNVNVSIMSVPDGWGTKAW
jgi:hypothetical protein